LALEIGATIVRSTSIPTVPMAGWQSVISASNWRIGLSTKFGRSRRARSSRTSNSVPHSPSSATGVSSRPAKTFYEPSAADARSEKKRERFRPSALRASVGRCAAPGAPRPPGAHPSDICKWQNRRHLYLADAAGGVHERRDLYRGVTARYHTSTAGPIAAAGGPVDDYSVLGTRRARRAVARARKRSRMTAKSPGGNMPYATELSSPPGARLKSGPGQRNSFHSESTIQERSASSFRRFLTGAGISTARAGCAGGLCVTGSTRTRVSPASSAGRSAATIAQGRFLPSSRPARCSLCQR